MAYTRATKPGPRSAKAPRRRAAFSSAAPAASAHGPRLVESTALMQATSMALRAQGKTVGFVPTLGALHDGHLALIREARQRADFVVVSVFVNPLQFGPKEDLSRYPRTLEQDLALCRAAGVDVVFFPDVRVMYPEGFQTLVRAGPLAAPFEGKRRPGHFDGVLTVVAKLFHLVQPHFTVFGEKDYQQLLLVRRMVQDLHLPVEVVAMPVLRDTDGLALSSRNRYLSNRARPKATALYRALCAAQERAAAGERNTKRLLTAARRELRQTPELEVEYAAIVDPRTLAPLSHLEGPARLLLAGSLGKRPRVRLLDNGPLFPG